MRLCSEVTLGVIRDKVNASRSFHFDWADVTPELKAIHCPDIDDVRNWVPDGDDVCFWVELSIGLANRDAADVFQVCIATAGGLKSTGRDIKPRGPARARPIVLQRYSWPALEKELRDRLEASSGESWLEVQEKLRRHFDWEFEDYRAPG